MVFGMEGKSGGVLVPLRLETSGPPTGVAAGLRLAVWRSPWWRWWEGSTIARRMMMMARGRARWTGVRRLRDTAGLGMSTPAGTTRGTWPGPPARSLSGRCCGRHGVTTDVSETRDVFPCRVFSYVQASSTCGGPTRGSWAVPSLWRWKPRTWVERNLWLFSTAWPWTNVRTWYAWKEKRLLVRVTPPNRPWSHFLSSLLSPRQRPCDDSSVP